MVGTGDYLGLGVLAENKDSLTLPRFFSAEVHAPATAWLWKLVFTVVTLSVGFKGGEVTPLFSSERLLEMRSHGFSMLRLISLRESG